MRGYAWSGRNQGFLTTRKLINSLSSVRVLSNSTGSRWFFGASAVSVELLVRQFIYDRYGVTPLSRAVYQFWGDKKPITLAMPRAWRNHLDTNGFSVNGFASKIAWQSVVLNRFAHGLLVALSLIKRIWRNCPASVSKSCPSSYVMFESLQMGNLPSNQSDQHSFDICTFYEQWSERNQSIQEICHNVPNAGHRYAGDLPVIYRLPAYQLATGKRNALLLTAWTIGAFIFAGIQYLRGHWEYALMLAEAVKARSVRMCNSAQLAREYFFHMSGTIYRPMWTYDVQSRGSDVSLYFYSTYDQPKLLQGYEPQHFGWGPANWPRYIVWDAYQTSILKRDLGNFIKVTNFGAVYFSDSEEKLQSLPSKSVAVFDIQPHRSAAHFGISTMADCLAEHHDFYHRFLEDIAEVVEACSGNILLKGKRDIGGSGNKRYRGIVNLLSKKGCVKIIPPNISAMRLIPVCSASISFPFTSTAIYFRDAGIPSIFYDPYGWMQKDDGAARGVPIIQGKVDLRKWLEQVLHS